VKKRERYYYVVENGKEGGKGVSLRGAIDLRLKGMEESRNVINI
jgi:hypothetical protein